MTADDRHDRERARTLGRMLDVRTPGGGLSTHRMLVQVYDGGSLPTEANKVHLCRPVVADAADTEGASPTYAADTSETIPVVVLGTAAAAGDYLIAHAIGGRWVAVTGGAVGDCFPSCESCGHRYNWAGGSVTDDNGTWDADTGWFAPIWFPPSATGFGRARFPSTDVEGCSPTGSPLCGSYDVIYYYEFDCERVEGKVSARLSVAIAQDCSFGVDNFLCSPDFGLDVAFSEWSDVTPSSCDPLTASFSFSKDVGYPASLPLPTTSASISIPIDESSTSGYVCAVPCKIPAADLTLSWDNTIDGPGSITLEYNSAVDTWDTTSAPWGSGDTGTASITLDAGLLETLLAIGASSPSIGCGSRAVSAIYANVCISAYDCDPFHIHYKLDADSCYPVVNALCASLISLGYTDFYLDYP